MKRSEPQPPLKIHTFGGLHILRGNKPVGRFTSRKALALLVYLAMTAKPASREFLADLFWDDRSQEQAQSNLRTILSLLNRDFAPYLEISRHSIGLKPQRSIWVDALALSATLSGLGGRSATPALSLDAQRIEAVLDLYEGKFLEGFNLSNARGFEHWMVMEAEALQTQVLSALRKLVDHYFEIGDYERGIDAARRLLRLNSLLESVHRQVMRMLAYTGQREQALEQFEACQAELEKELGVAPQRETVSLYEQIRDDELKPPEIASPAISVLPVRPAFLTEGEVPHGTAAPVFVGREEELDDLGARLQRALAGQGQLAFVVGEAGTGKTSLLNEFSRQAQIWHPELAVARGVCTAYTGVGDPYLPFRDLLGMLTGDVDDMWQAGTLSMDHAQRLWALVPAAVEALVQCGPDLIGGLIDGPALASRAAAHSPRSSSSTRLLQIIQQNEIRPPGASPQQSRLFRHYTEVLKALAVQNPLVLILDDLHWMDASSAGLLFHLSREIPSSQIFVVGAYRPEEVSRAAGDEVHPLASLLSEFKRQFGDIWIDLDRVSIDEGRGFIDALIDSEPNRLGEQFRSKLTTVTRGHPLFTVEQLRDMQARGDILRDEDERWIEGEHIHWDAVPARMEGVVAKRVSRIDGAMQRALKIGSVEGEMFTAEVVAHVMGLDAHKLVTQLNEDVDGRHRLVREQAVIRLSSTQLTQYLFRHNLYQYHLYQGLAEGERRYLHQAVGEGLEHVYGDEAERVAVQLARHFEESGQGEKAIHYLHRAAQRALGVSANQEAVAHLSRGLELLHSLPPAPPRVGQELELLVLRAIGLMNSKGYGDPEVGEAFSRARVICQEIGAVPQLAPVFYGLSAFYLARADYPTSTSFGEQILALAPDSEQPALLRVLGHNMMIANLSMQGKFRMALEHGQSVMENYHPDQHRMLVQLAGDNLSVTTGSWRMVDAFLTGDREGARAIQSATLAHARELGHPNSIAFCLAYSLFLDHLERNPRAVLAIASEHKLLADEHDFVMHNAFGLILRGWALATGEQDLAALEMMKQGLGVLDAIGLDIFRPHLLTMLGEVEAFLGDPARGLETLEEALHLGEERGERWFEADTYWTKGKLLQQMGGDKAVVAECYRKAAEVAHEQEARFLEELARESLTPLE